MRPVIFATLAALVPVSAAALTCEYVVECFEQETCQPTDFTIQITPGEMEELDEVAGVSSGVAELRDVAGTQTGRFVTMQDITVVENHATGSDTLFRLVIGADGASRYQVLILDGPLAVTYHGTCKETD